MKNKVEKPVDNVETANLKVMCSGISSCYFEEDLRRIFEDQMGKVDDIRLVFEEKDPIGKKRPHRGYGFVKFSSHDDTDKAFRTMNGILIYGRELTALGKSSWAPLGLAVTDTCNSQPTSWILNFEAIDNLSCDLKSFCVQNKFNSRK